MTWRAAEERDFLRDEQRDEHEHRAQAEEDAEQRRDSRPLEGSDEQ